MRRSRRTFTLVAVIATLAIGLGRAFQPAPTPPKPGSRAALLASPRDGGNFGEAWENQRFVWKLPLTNNSPEPVRVLDVRTSCTCVSAEPRSFTLQPGATRDLTLVLDLTPRAIEKAGTVRPFAVDVAVVTETDSLPSAPEKFAVTGTVRPVLDVQPRDPAFGTRSSHVQPPLPASFTVVPSTALETLTAVCDSPAFAAEVRPVKGSNALTVTVTPTRPIDAGPFAADVRLLPVQPGGKALPERRVAVLGLIAPDVTADPPQVAVAARPVGETAEATVSVGSLTGRAVAVEKATAHGDGVTVEVTPEGMVRVRLAVAREGEFRGRVEVEVRAGKDAAPVTLTVPVFGYGTAPGGTR